jgi:hypothetical protein
VDSIGVVGMEHGRYQAVSGGSSECLQGPSMPDDCFDDGKDSQEDSVVHSAFLAIVATSVDK